MSDLTMLEDARESYALGGTGSDFKDVYFARLKEFDRWLASVKAETLRDAAREILSIASDPWDKYTPAARWLRASANRIEDRAEWPEAHGEEREFRRPMLVAVLALCEAHIAQQPADIITKLADKWGEA